MGKKIRHFACFTAGLALLLPAGCGGPTYGTGKTSGQQAVEDFANITKWGSLSNNAQVDSRPRPPLVRPTAADLSRPLPPPQQALAAQGNAAWPESPEQRRARLRAEAGANAGNPNYQSPIIQDDAPGGRPYYPSPINRSAQREYDMPSPQVAKQQDALYRQLKAEQNAAPKTRKYLSQPPLDYYKPSPNAPAGDLGKGEDEPAAKPQSGRERGIYGRD